MDTIKLKSGNVKMIAHRGLSGVERENTYPAFVAAGNRSYYGIETDVHKTADGNFVIIHDETTERVSLGKVNINVETSDYVQLENIVLPDFDESMGRQDIRIPLLIDYIKICKRYNKVCVLELKNAFVKDDIKRIIEEFKSVEYLENAIFISFNLQNCIILRSLLPENDIQWLLMDKVTEEVIKVLAENKLDLDIYYKYLTKEIVEKLHLQGIKVNCWTCDDKEDAEKLSEMGVDFITSNIIE